jgi:outer membrane immunogenic protein
MPTLKIATNAALSITPKNVGAGCRLLCNPRRLNLSENETIRLRETYTPPRLKCARKKLEQIGSLETRRAAIWPRDQRYRVTKMQHSWILFLFWGLQRDSAFIFNVFCNPYKLELSMRRASLVAIVAVSTIAFAQIASAADLPVKAPALVAAPLYNWTGPYTGIAGGVAWGHSKQTDPGIPCDFFGTCLVITNPNDDGSYAVTGGIIGGTLGYNWQRGPWVFGLEGDYSWADVSGNSQTCGAATPSPHECGTKLESLGTFRGRIGYAMGTTGNWLPYVTGGLAVGELNAWDALFPSSGSDFRAGWAAGAGVEVGFERNWTFKVEYLYVDLGSRQMFNVVPGVPETVSFTANIVRAGFNYKFY